MPTAAEQIAKLKNADAAQVKAIADEEKKHEGGPRKSVADAIKARSAELKTDPDDTVQEAPSDDDHEEERDSAQKVSDEALTRKHEEAIEEEPFDGYRALDEDEVVEELKNQGIHDVTRILGFEKRNENRSKIVKAAEDLLEGYKASTQEVRYPGSPRHILENSEAFGDVDDVDIDVDAIAKAGPYSEGSIQQQAARSQQDHNVDDPTKFFPNAKYVQERDHTHAAMFQEGVVSSSPDDHSQRIDAALHGASKLREEVDAANSARPESSIHEEALIAADKGEPWPPYEPPAEETREERDKRNEEARDKKEDEARKVAKQLHGEVVAEHRASTPAPPGSIVIDHPDGKGIALAATRHAPYDESFPPSGNFQPFSAVSRRDESHEKLGVVVRADDQPHTGLVLVSWPDGEGWINTLNLRYEGDARVLTRERAKTPA